MENWNDYRVPRKREVIDNTLKKVLFKLGGKPYDTSLAVLGDLIQFYSILFRFIKERYEDFALFLMNFNGVEQINKSLDTIHKFVKQFDNNLPIVKFGV